MSSDVNRPGWMLPPAPRRIEDDPLFSGWSAELPRLWYLAQRDATRLDAESLYGASFFAVVYSRSEIQNLTPLEHTGEVGIRGYLREGEHNAGAEQSGTRVLAAIRDEVQPLRLFHTGRINRPSASPAVPVVHPIPPDNND